MSSYTGQEEDNVIRMTTAEIAQERLSMDARAKQNGRIADLERQVVLLERLVERMGCDFNTFRWGVNAAVDYPYTIAGQRQWDAAMHEAEGPPPDAGMLEAVQ